MRNRERAFGERLWRAVVIGFGVLGGLAAIDAVLLFSFLVVAAVFFEAPNPYIGLLIFVVCPAVAVFGGAMAWTAYWILKRRAPQSQADRPRAAA